MGSVGYLEDYDIPRYKAIHLSIFTKSTVLKLISLNLTLISPNEFDQIFFE